MRNRWVYLLLSMMMLSACAKLEKQFSAYTPDRNTAYLDHEVEKPMTVPANLSVDPEEMQNYYPVPEGALPAADAEPVDIVPPPVVKYEQTEKPKQPKKSKQSKPSEPTTPAEETTSNG